jgi:hypothetical protein
VSSLVNALICGVMSCCRCLCFRSSSLCPPLGIELNVGTLIHTVPTASTYNTKARFSNCIVQRGFFAREDRTNCFAKNSNNIVVLYDGFIFDRISYIASNGMLKDTTFDILGITPFVPLSS